MSLEVKYYCSDGCLESEFASKVPELPKYGHTRNAFQPASRFKYNKVVTAAVFGSSASSACNL
jgi:hypothetical protein